MTRICDNFIKKTDPALHGRLLLLKQQFDHENRKLIKTEGKAITGKHDKEAQDLHYRASRCPIF